MGKIIVLASACCFGTALAHAKQGAMIAREGWNGDNMFAYVVPEAAYPAQTGVAKAYFGEDAKVPYRAYLALKTAQGDVATWAPSGSDVLAEDWLVLSIEEPAAQDTDNSRNQEAAQSAQLSAGMDPEYQRQHVRLNCVHSAASIIQSGNTAENDVVKLAGRLSKFVLGE